MLNLSRQKGVIKIEIKYLQKLLHKALIYRLMANINEFLKNANIRHYQLSEGTRRAKNWFNDAYNNNEDIQLSSLSKIMAFINSIDKIEKYQLSDLFDEKVLLITTVMMSLGDEETNHIHTFINSERDLFEDLIGDWGTLEAKKKLTELEQKHFKIVESLVAKEENN